MIYTVTFEITGCYEDSNGNDFKKKALSEVDFEAKSLNKLFELLDKQETIDSVDDSAVIDASRFDDLYETIIEYVCIVDSRGREVYRDSNWESIGG